jgi:glycerol-3-phosphate acyltransferase PlsY
VIAAPFAAAAAGFAIGSVPFGWLLVRGAAGGDVRRSGSGNVGATNVLRVAGPGLALATLLLDAGKGAAAVGLACAIGPQDVFSAPAGGLAAMVGHVLMPWLGGRGGKGAATGAGAFAVLAPGPLAISLAVFGIVVALARRVSPGSLAAALALPAAAALLGSGSITVAAGCCSAAILFWSHRENLRRLVAGREPRIGRRDGREEKP